MISDDRDNNKSIDAFISTVIIVPVFVLLDTVGRSLIGYSIFSAINWIN